MNPSNLRCNGGGAKYRCFSFEGYQFVIEHDFIVENKVQFVHEFNIGTDSQHLKHQPKYESKYLTLGGQAQ